MENINHTHLTCGNSQKLAEIVKSSSFSNLTDEVTLKDGKAHISTRWSIPDKEIALISKENPDLVFTAEYTFESDCHSVVEVVEYKNGESNHIEQKPNYLINSQGGDAQKCIEEIIGDHFHKLLDQAKEIFRRIDTVEVDGIKKVHFFENEVIITIEDDEFRMKFLKKGYMVDILDCFKKQTEVKYTWIRVDSQSLYPNDDDFDLPF